ncbi:metallophosphoesterase [Luteolibacter flavescens]|uniref:Metallophosphoesterase n=1 Tax=Luteolibacter flavescens TaxID=1859460 RepID=A0ABT3FN50_9BACT|nr:metallophosphoesterase [Luteolibacter flavescens]MCW1884887.1 metallophosphoesterase [Luteolibacter flavescens]
MPATNRRQFLAAIPLAGAGLAAVGQGQDGTPTSSVGAVTFGFITDVHHGTHGKDQVARLTPFIDAAIARRPDFILQCGDFCCAKGGISTARDFLAEWNRFPGARHHVIGNHDCDYQTKEELLEAWQIPHRHYSFDVGDFHFVVLDRNHFIDDEGTTVSYANGNWYPIHRKGGPGHLARVSCIDREQLAWLAKDLAATDKPIVIFQHQPSGVGSHEGNWDAVNFAIDSHNARRGRVQVVAVLAGHDHDEQHSIRHGVHHLTLTSSTFGMPPNGSTTYYESSNPPFTFITLDPARKEMRIEESRTTYEEQEAMKPEHLWLTPPLLRARMLALG